MSAQKEAVLQWVAGAERAGAAGARDTGDPECSPFDVLPMEEVRWDAAGSGERG